MAEHDGPDAPETLHAPAPSNVRGCCATVMNSSSNVALPCSPGSVFGLPWSRIFPCETNSTRSAHVLDLVHVVRSPQHAARALRNVGPDPAADVARHRRVERGGRFVQQQQVRAIEHRFGESRAGLFARGQHAGLHVAKGFQIKLFQQLFDSFGQIVHSVDKSEDAQVLGDGEISWQRRIDGREIRAFQSLGTMGGEIHPFDADAARTRLNDAENHVDGRGLSRAIGTQQTDDLIASDLE